MSAPKPPASIATAIAREMHDQHDALMRRDYHEGWEPSAFAHQEMWMARAEPYAQAVWDALLAEGEDRTGPEMYAIRSGRRVLVTEVDAS